MKTQGKNIFGKEIEWVWVMRKIGTPFALSYFPQGMIQGKKAFRYPQYVTAQWYDHADVYLDKEEIEMIKKLLKYQIMQDDDYPTKIAKSTMLITKKIQKYNLSEEKIKNESLSFLIAQLKKDLSLFFDILGYMSYRGSVQMAEVLGEEIEAILTHKLAQRNKLPSFQNSMHALNIPSQPSVMIEEKKYLLKKALGFRLISRKKQDRIISEYIQNYEWLSYHWFLGKPLKKEDVRIRFLEYSKNAKEELRKLIKRQKELQENTQKLVKEYAFTIREQEILKQYQTWIFLRTYVKDHINLLAYKMLPLLYLISEKSGLLKDDILYLSLEEIEKIEHKNGDKLYKKIEERRKGFSAGVIENKFIFRDFKKPQENIIQQQIIKGQVAHKGVLQGKVKVVLSPQDQGKILQGDILVTPMTTPDFLPCMERAAAFITDEGGITCHAAIVAREMKKPCIVGTRHGTKILKDGDFIELDAEQGIIRILDHNH